MKRNKRKKPDCKEQKWTGHILEQNVSFESNESLAYALAETFGKSDEGSREIYKTILTGLSELNLESTRKKCPYSDEVPTPK